MKKDKDKKLTYFLRAAMMILTTILIVLFLVIMSMVGKIQGTARVVNYAGFVRGGTQRMVKLEISGEYKTEYYMGQTFDLSGMTFTATWSDERVENPTAEEVQVAGFDTNKKGWQTVTISYKEASATVRVRVKTSIKVTFSLLGDKMHDCEYD